MEDKHGKVYLVSTPIGNLKDITFRAVETLKRVPLIAAEDTRHSKVLLSHYNISTPLISYFEHNKFSRIPKLMDHLKANNQVSTVTILVSVYFSFFLMPTGFPGDSGQIRGGIGI